MRISSARLNGYVPIFPTSISFFSFARSSLIPFNFNFVRSLLFRPQKHMQNSEFFMDRLTVANSCNITCAWVWLVFLCAWILWHNTIRHTHRHIPTSIRQSPHDFSRWEHLNLLSISIWIVCPSISFNDTQIHFVPMNVFCLSFSFYCSFFTWSSFSEISFVFILICVWFSGGNSLLSECV